ncbi:MAG: hypothetical protein IPO36_00015 [Anaerolineales bacterium]|nr:hypothetical protein [Anaerolineales bacterium]
MKTTDYRPEAQMWAEIGKTLGDKTPQASRKITVRALPTGAGRHHYMADLRRPLLSR